MGRAEKREVARAPIPRIHENIFQKYFWISTTTQHDTALQSRLHARWASLTVPICRYALERCVVLGGCAYSKIFLKNIFVDSRHGDTIMLRQREIYYEMTSAKTHDWTMFWTMQQRLYRRRVCINMILVRFYQSKIQNLTISVGSKTSRKIRRILFYYVFLT